MTEPAVTTPETAQDIDKRQFRATRGQLAVLVAALVAILVFAVVAAGLAGYKLAGTAAPADDSAEAGFARDMQTHHAQAVEMSLMVRDKSDDPVVRAVAYDVTTSQQQQIGQMFGWLRLWGLSPTSTRSPMSWMQNMDHGDMGGTSTGDGALLADGRMPGMASEAEIDELAQADGTQAEVLWLELMIPHHRAGIVMAEAIQEQTDRPEVLELAGSIVTAQKAEIEQMRQLLEERGAAR